MKTLKVNHKSHVTVSDWEGQCVSFWDVFIGASEIVAITREKVDLIAQKLVYIDHEERNFVLPRVHLDENDFQCMCSMWKML